MRLSLRNKLYLKGSSQHKNINYKFQHLKNNYKRENNEQQDHIVDNIATAKPI